MSKSGYENSGKAESKILAIDLQKMADIPGVIEIQDDITSQSAVDKVLFHFEGQKADLVVCDGAPDVIGRNDFDEFIQDQLLLAALRISVQILKPGGDFVAKIFRGKEVSLMAAHLSAFFEKVAMAKPGSCRTSSIESFVVCNNFKSPCDSSSFQQFIDAQVLQYFKSGSPQTVIPFVSCKSAPHYDPDMNHPLQVSELHDLKFLILTMQRHVLTDWNEFIHLQRTDSKAD
jgi:tRNA (cytidine32/guanosine34-2'-O)-methyltransferase